MPFRRLSRPVAPPPTFASLQAMTPAQRSAALVGREAARWIESAARYGLVEAQVMLGQRLLDGDSMRRDPAAALRWFLAAAGADNPAGLNMAGRCHEHGWGTAPDPAQAAPLYFRAAELGLDWAQFNLAGLLLLGRGAPRDRPGALRWYQAAAQQGHAKSMNMIGRFLEQGWDTPAQPDAAIAWYRQAAALGDFRGQFNLGSLLAQQGCRAEALTWLTRAVSHGSPDFLQEAGTALLQSDDPAYHALGRLAWARSCHDETVYAGP